MFKKFGILLISLFYYNVNAQEVVVNVYEERDRTGYEVEFNYQTDQVSDFLTSYFKEYGKVRKRGGIYNITNLSRADFPYPEITVFSEVKRKSRGSRAMVWIADSLFEENIYSQKLNELWYTFGVDFYRHLKQLEIDESSQALRYAEKQAQRLEKDSLNLQSDLEKNRNEKVKLEQALRENEVNYTNLLKSIEHNSYAKDSVILAIDKIKRLIKLQEQEKNAIQ